MPRERTPNDPARGLAWALVSRGRTARALRALLPALRSERAIAELGAEGAAKLSGEPMEAVLPLFGEPAGLARAERALAKVGARVVSLLDDEYPDLLREIPDAPPYLFVRGRPLVSGVTVAIVGARRASRAALEAAEAIAGGLAGCGVTIVSGFARGVDAAAHRASLEAGGTTLAVFGCGIDVCYPPEQWRLLERLLENGTALTEFPPGAEPLPAHFPVRNRIIAGLSRLALVVEAAERSGSLITARCAAEYGRDVAAVPGAAVSRGAAGSNALLKDGAILVRNAADVLVELPAEDRARLRLPADEAEPRTLPALDADASAVLAALDQDDAKDADALVAATGLPAARLSSALVRLELDGLVSALPGALFVRAR